MALSDSIFDFLTQDVFEYIFHPYRAAAGTIRVLKPGGVHIFTAPKHKRLRKSYPRVKLVNGIIENLMEDVYHDNSVGDGKALLTWDYGDDFEALIHQWSPCGTTTYVTRDRGLGIDGEFIEVFVTRKK